MSSLRLWLTVQDRLAPLPNRVLFAAGDPGGANAIRPVLQTLVDQGHAVAVLDHGVLARGLPPFVPLVDASHSFDVLCFGTSLKDPLPLAFARQAQAKGKRTVSVLDNWLNYRSRLATDGLPVFIPDIYAVMDDKAKTEALADGLPADCLAVTGHPNLASLAQDIAKVTPQWTKDFRQSLGLGINGRGLVTFINEPAASDQGTGPDNPLWRGYTEETVLAMLASHLAGAEVDVAIVAHPRDDTAKLSALWERVRGDCSGKVCAGQNGRDMILAADRVAGMTSILLYESWLVGHPTLSLQPGLVRDDLLSIATRPGIVLARQAKDVGAQVVHWLGRMPGPAQPDLTLHAGAAQRIAALLV